MCPILGGAPFDAPELAIAKNRMDQIPNCQDDSTTKMLCSRGIRFLVACFCRRLTVAFCLFCLRPTLSLFASAKDQSAKINVKLFSVMQSLHTSSKLNKEACMTYR